ncbi:CPBP family intramembrane glutamic endopeptidase [Ruegeria faecimaris]|uniref:CPBP family intramembrane glutamic endopeptidase n=1 Tax=Ruegeria faecimaris TaxID=686389 RepID=UPI00248F66CC|nr:CPBP family intramembrane glutamic endopeptidase [Ruegeria faecimaris]
MAHFISVLPVVWPWFILIAAQICAVSGKWSLGFVLLTCFGLIALTLGLVTPFAAAIASAGLTGALMLRGLNGAFSFVGHIALILWCLAMGAHLVPGFHNLLVLDQAHSGPGSTDFTMYLNLDKPLILFAVLLAWPRMNDGLAYIRKSPLAVGLVALPVLFLLGLSVGAIRPESTLPHWWMIFALSNLFLTCLTEEAFFRGYLQSALSKRLGAAAGIAAASLLFGLAHFAGGPALVVFAALLGAACGLGYYATGRLWVPVLMHFAFNAAHLVIFTYPGPA